VRGIAFTCSALAIGGLLIAAAAPGRERVDDWPSYGHDPGGARASPLVQITRANVSSLKIAWTFHTGDAADGRAGGGRSGFESTPLVVDGRLYVTTPFNRVIALDAETGAVRWTFDPKIESARRLRRRPDQPRRRDVGGRTDAPEDPAAAVCSRRRSTRG